MTCKTGAITSRSLWRTIGFSWSGPAALWGLRSFNNFNTPFRETEIFGICGTELRVLLGIWDGLSMPSSTKSCTAMHVSWLSFSGVLGVKTDWNCWLRMLALSVVFVYNWPFCFRGAEPFEYIFWLFQERVQFFSGESVCVRIRVSLRVSVWIIVVNRIC